MPFYEWSCEECGKAASTFEHRCRPEAPTCPDHGRMVRDWHAEARVHTPGSVFPYVTRNINGEPIEVRSHGHLKELCKLHGVRLRDDTAYIDEEYRGYDIRSKDQNYSGGSGRGLPGQWV
jgi:predicted nucleic acid-binding Zn ribbon protein